MKQETKFPVPKNAPRGSHCNVAEDVALKGRIAAKCKPAFCDLPQAKNPARQDSIKTENKEKEYFEKIEGITIIPSKVNTKIDKLLMEFVLSDVVDIKMPEE